MKKAVLFSLFATFLVSPAVYCEQPVQKQTPEQKNQCLLTSKACADQVDSIQQRIKKLNEEIKKGTKVYSPEDLKKLDQKLKETQELLDRIEYGYGS